MFNRRIDIGTSILESDDGVNIYAGVTMVFIYSSYDRRNSMESINPGKVKENTDGDSNGDKSAEIVASPI